MKRRILLVIATFVVLFAAFWVYRFFAAGDEREHALRGKSIHRPEMPFVVGPDRRPTPGRAEHTRIERRDEFGRLRREYKFRQFDKRDDGAYEVRGVDVRIYRKDGQRWYIRAERGVVYAEEIAGGFKLQRGSLSGDVEIFLDRSTDLNRPASPERFEDVVRQLAQRLDDVIRIYADDIHFANDLLMIHTKNDFALYSSDLDIIGRGLDIRWNEAPSELRLLRIEQGWRMCIHKAPVDVSLAGVGASRAAPPATGSSASAERPPGQKKPMNIYQVTFTGSEELVNVVSGPSRMRGAKVLSLKMEWRGAWQGGGVLEPQPERTETTGASEKLAAGGAKRPDREATIITWRGPLVVKPVGRTDTPSPDRYTVSASGERVLLSDPETAAVCKSFEFRRTDSSRSGRLVGTEDRPARLILAGGELIDCRDIHFDGGTTDDATINLDGPGTIIQPDRDKPADRNLLLTADLRELSEAKADSITWKTSVVARLTPERADSPDGKAGRTPVLKDATFIGDVVLKRVESGDSVRSDKLHVTMGRASDGSSYPQRAVATGNVVARQVASDIEAGELTVDFDEAEEKKADDKARLKIEATNFLATGGVKISGSDEGEWFVAEADSVDSDLAGGTAILTGKAGKPATILMGKEGVEEPENSLSGPEITLNRKRESVLVMGAGAMDFQTDTDMNGEKLAKPRTIRITWLRQMDYQGDRNLAIFDGDVKLAGGQDRMTCRTMRLFFEKVPQKPKAGEPAAAAAIAAKPAKGSRSDRMAIEMERFSRRRISMIVAEKDVTLTSVRKKLGRIEQRMELTGPELHYDPIRKRMNVIGHGTLLLEDYREPRQPDDKKADGGGIGRSIQRPSQTAFEWRKSMQIVQEKRRVVLDGDVTMVHRSGDQLVLAGKLNVPDRGKLPPGRKTVLTCDKMWAQFEPPEKKPAAAKAVAKKAAGAEEIVGPSIGPLELFTAMGNVHLKDGTRQIREILGQHLLYDKRKQLVIILGYLPGQPLADANLIFEDKDTGESRPWSSPKITCLFDGNRIIRVETDKLQGAGGR